MKIRGFQSHEEVYNSNEKGLWSAGKSTARESRRKLTFHGTMQTSTQWSLTVDGQLDPARANTFTTEAFCDEPWLEKQSRGDALILHNITSWALSGI